MSYSSPLLALSVCSDACPAGRQCRGGHRHQGAEAAGPGSEDTSPDTWCLSKCSQSQAHEVWGGSHKTRASLFNSYLKICIVRSFSSRFVCRLSVWRLNQVSLVIASQTWGGGWGLLLSRQNQVRPTPQSEETVTLLISIALMQTLQHTLFGIIKH